MTTDETLPAKCLEPLADKCNINPQCHFNVLITIIKMDKMERTWFQQCKFKWVPGIWILGTIGYRGACISDPLERHKWCLSHQLCLFHNESHLSLTPGQSFFVFSEIKLSLMTLFPKFILIYRLPYMPWPYRCAKKTSMCSFIKSSCPEWAARAWSCSFSSTNFSQKNSQRHKLLGVRQAPECTVQHGE